jgi:hypothetical protein
MLTPADYNSHDEAEVIRPLHDVIDVFKEGFVGFCRIFVLERQVAVQIRPSQTTE